MNSSDIRLLFFVTEQWYFNSHRKELASRLARIGLSIQVGTNLGDVSNDSANEGLSLYQVPFSRSLKRPYRDLICLFRIPYLIHRTDATIVHNVAIKPILSSILAVIIFRKVKFIHAFAGLGYMFSSPDRKAGFLRKLILPIIEFILSRRNSWVLVQNNDDREYFLASKSIASSKVVMIPGSGIDVEKYCPKAINKTTSDSSRTVILVARMLYDKGVEEFVDAAKYIKISHPDVKFVLVGDIDPDNPAAIPEQRLIDWGREGTIEWWGHQSDLVPIYQQAEVVCLPSYREGLPKVLLEAAACGKPMVASDVPGCRDICIHEETGLLVQPRNVDDLSDALARMLRDDDLREFCGLKARELAVRRFSLDVISEQTLALYECVTNTS